MNPYYLITIHKPDFILSGIPHPARPRDRTLESHLLTFVGDHAASVIDGFARADLGQTVTLKGCGAFSTSTLTLRLATEEESSEEGIELAHQRIRNTLNR